MGVGQPLFREVKIRSKPHGEQRFRLSCGSEQEGTLWLHWSIAVCCVQKRSRAPAHLLLSCSHMHTPIKQEKYESSRHHSSSPATDPATLTAQARCAIWKQRAHSKLRHLLDLIGEVQRLLSTSSCKILRAWTPCNEHLSELKWKSL